VRAWMTLFCAPFEILAQSRMSVSMIVPLSYHVAMIRVHRPVGTRETSSDDKSGVIHLAINHAFRHVVRHISNILGLPGRRSLHFLKPVAFHNELLALMGRIDYVILNEEADERYMRFGPGKNFSVKECYPAMNFGGELHASVTQK
jgi:hypothetical protein